jgi:very-short-patch-repair endonuclease
LASESEQLSWIPDQINGPIPPITDSEFREHLELRWNLPAEAQAAAEAQLPNPDDLAPASDVEALFAKEGHFAQRRVDAASRFGDWVNQLSAYSDEKISEVAETIGSYAKRLSDLTKHAGWTHQAASEVVEGRDAVWSALNDELTVHHEALDQASKALGNAAVEVDVEASLSVLRAGATELIDHAEKGKALRTNWLATGAAREHRDILENTKVNGSAALSLDQLRLLEAHLVVEHELEQIEQCWKGRIERFEGSSFAQRRAFHAGNLTLLSQILSLQEPLAEAKRSFNEMGVLPRPTTLTDAAALDQIADGLKGELENRQSAAVSQAIDDAYRRIGEDPHVVSAQLRRAIGERDSETYRGALASLRDARVLAEQEHRRRQLESELSSIPGLRAQLPDSADDTWIQRSNEFGRAWSWRYAYTELGRLLDPEEPRRLKAEIEGLENRERATLAEITSLLAWSGMFSSLTPIQDQALTAWTYAISRIGRGTGKYAEQHRRTAREYMNIARDAIPAWIMPTYRVAENLDVSPEPFDVVIVDEASQSGVESLFLFYIGKQVVVVGDDQQIAPEAVGIDMSEVARLQRQYLEDVPFKAEFGPTSSLFNQADIRFGNRVVLREHFRCMPEIIEFSNRISYPEKSLWPLRQYGSDRLDPIKTVYLPHGYREGGTAAINRPEAEEIVARIEKMCADPRYDDRTIGVISLQGDAQAYLIDQLLIERLGPQVMAERGLICGDAYAFQGDERDVMLLSMVAAPNANIGALSNAQARRRFNVAGSRAKDQAWLVASVKPGELSTTDVRRAILEYYLDPDVEKWEELAGFDESVINPPFESRFEQDVYLRLRGRAYQVKPQFRVGGYRIDLVLRGSKAKLAVECDGDEWHGSERWEDDSSRQRRLERSGWTFVRIRGSDFYRDPDDALSEVWRQADRLGIEPGAVRESERSTVEPPITGPEQDLDEPAPESVSESVASDQSQSALELKDQKPEDDPQGTPPISEQAVAEEEQTVDLEQAQQRPSPVSSDVSLGMTLYHDRLGAGHVTAIGRVRRAGEPWVRIRFEEDQFEYTPEEYERADFRTGPPEDLTPSRWTGTSRLDHAPTSETFSFAHEADSDRLEGGRGALAAYEVWSGEGLPDPRTADRVRVAQHLMSIVEVEGPLTTDRAYRLYIRAAGFSRVTKQARGPLNRALFHLGSRVVFDELTNPETNWPQRVVRIPGTPPVVVRRLGDRDLYEVPLNEIAELMLMGRRERVSSTREQLMRYVLDTYGLSRLTRRAEIYLEAAVELISPDGE